MRAKGIDISKYQNKFTFQNNVDFVIIKATEGWAVDPWYGFNVDEVVKAPVRGAYHYFRTASDPIVQANNLIANTKEKGLHFLAVDYEAKNNVLDESGATNYLACLMYLMNNQPLPVIIYTSSYIYRDNLRHWHATFDQFPLWLARYSGQDPETSDPTSIVERDWSVWQHTSDGDGPYYGTEKVDDNYTSYIDEDVYNGTLEEMKAWLGVEEDCCEELEAKIAQAINNNTNSIMNNAQIINSNSLGIAELAKRLATLQQGQLELAENGLGYEDKFAEIEANAIFWDLNIDNHNSLVGEVKAMDEVVQANAVDIEKNKLELNDCVDVGAFMAVVDKLNERIDGLEGGHNHPAWFKRWGLVK